jgi:hypothetical protein
MSDAETMARALIFAATDPHEVAMHIRPDVARAALRDLGWTSRESAAFDGCEVWDSPDGVDVVTLGRESTDGAAVYEASRLAAKHAGDFATCGRIVVLARWLVASMRIVCGDVV